MVEIAWKILKRIFAVTFLILVGLAMLLALIDYDKGVLWNVVKLIIFIAMVLFFGLSIETIEDWYVEKEERKEKE